MSYTKPISKQFRGGFSKCLLFINLVFTCLACIAFVVVSSGQAWAEPNKHLKPPAKPVLLTVSGAIKQFNVGNEAHLDSTFFEQLPRHTVATTTSVTDGVQYFEGVLMQHVLDALKATGQSVLARALNDYEVLIPISDFKKYKVLLALSMNGQPLTARDKGPLWIVYPRDQHRELQDIRYDYRWVWQLTHLTVQ